MPVDKRARAIRLVTTMGCAAWFVVMTVQIVHPQQSGQPSAQPAAPGGQPGAQPAAGAETPAVSLGEIQRMFDSYALMQAQEFLKVTDEQFPQFLTRFKGLQDIRRQALQERNRRVNDLRKVINAPQFDEAAAREELKGLQDLDARTQADVKRAYDAIDQILDLRQQARFRVFEENMERRKLDLVNRARQANKPRN